MANKEMRILNKVCLDYELAYQFVESYFEFGNELSKLIRYFDFKKGDFFTLLPDNANLKELYNFRSGNIFVEYFDNNKWDFVPGTSKEVINFIESNILEKKLTCVMENIVINNKSSAIEKFSKVLKKYHDNFYFFISNEEIQMLESSFYRSKLSNYFLAVLTTFSKDQLSSIELSEELLKSILEKAEMMVFGCYDGLGSIFWEKNS